MIVGMNTFPDKKGVEMMSKILITVSSLVIGAGAAMLTMHQTPQGVTLTTHPTVSRIRSTVPASPAKTVPVSVTTGPSRPSQTFQSSPWQVEVIGTGNNNGYSLGFGSLGLDGSQGMILQRHISSQRQAMIDMWSWHYRTGIPISGSGLSAHQVTTDLARVGIAFRPTS